MTDCDLTREMHKRGFRVALTADKTQVEFCYPGGSWPLSPNEAAWLAGGLQAAANAAVDATATLAESLGRLRAADPRAAARVVEILKTAGLDVDKLGLT